MSALWKLSQIKGKPFTDYTDVHTDHLKEYSHALNEVKHAIPHNYIFLNDEMIYKLNDFIVNVTKYTEKFMDIDAGYDTDTLENDFQAINELILRLRYFADEFKKYMQPEE